MAVNNSTLDSLALLAQAIGRDKNLLKWFGELKRKSISERRSEVHSLAGRMAIDRQDANLIYSLELLVDAKIFNAIDKALQEHGCIRDG